MIRPRLLLMIVASVLCPSASASTRDADAEALHRASSEVVWDTVNECHFDSTFGGLDWRGIRDSNDDLADHVADDAGFIELMNRMLGELRLSHYAVFRTDEKGRPRDHVRRYDRTRGASARRRRGRDRGQAELPRGRGGSEARLYHRSHR